MCYLVVTEGSAPATHADSSAAKPKSKKRGKLSEDDDRSDDPTVGVGSVAAGGRYDNLVGMFSGKGQIPCVGISFGVDRIFSIEKARLDAESDKEPRGNKTDVFVMAFGGKGFDGMLKDRMKICNMLWDAGINTEMLHKNKPKLQARECYPQDQMIVFYFNVLSQSSKLRRPTRYPSRSFLARRNWLLARSSKFPSVVRPVDPRTY